MLAIARAGRAAGCHEALFTLGERPELRYPVARGLARPRTGYASTVDYLAAMCRLVVEETGLLPHANAGALYAEELAALRPVSASQGMMLESLAEDLAAHRGAPDKEPARRLATLEAAGELAIPFTTGILVGIGDDRAGQLAALRAIAASHARHGHVQEVIVQNFLPKPGTAMARAEPCPPEDLHWAIAAARLVLPPEVHVQAPPNLSDELAPLLARRHRRLGRRVAGHGRPREPRAGLAGARRAARGHRGGRPHPGAPPDRLPLLRPRPRALARPGAALPRARRVRRRGAGPRRAVVLGRRGAAARAARTRPRAARRLPRRRPGGAVAEVLAGVALGQEVGEAEIVTLFGARGPEVRMVAEVADDLRRQVVGDAVTFVRNRNINYTNVCTFKCRFCAFSKGPLSLNLRGAPYLLELDEITRRVAEAEAEGATEVCLQGGIHPNFDGDYYLHVLEAVRAASADIHIHGFTALEVTEGARRSEVPLAEYLTRLKEAGLKTLPGTAAEILDDEVRAVICPDKINTEEWLEAHRTAHARRPALEHHHHVRLGRAAGAAGPGTWCAPGRSSARPAASPSSCRFPSCTWPPRSTSSSKARRGPTFRETLLMHAVARIAYRGRHRQHPGQLGQDGRRGGAPGAAGRGQRPGRHPDGREHLAGGGRPARAAHGRRGARGHRGAARAAPGAALHPVRARPGACARARDRRRGRRGRRRAPARLQRPVRGPRALAGAGPRARRP